MKYTEHEYGIEDPEGILMDCAEDYIEELNELASEIVKLKKTIQELEADLEFANGKGCNFTG
jgi:hypothetical protein